MAEPAKVEEPEIEQPDQEPPARASARSRLLPVAAMLLVTAAFFALSLAQSLTYPWNSDTASVALQGWYMVHGHLLLHGWWSSDVNFYTFDAPIYGLWALVLGLGSTAMHVAGAFIYTLAFLVGCWLAKGRSQGAAFGPRVALVALFMGMVLFNGGLLKTVMVVPDHNGTVVLILAAYVLYSRYAERRWSPWALLVLLTLGQLGDVSIRYVVVPAIVFVWFVDLPRTRRLRTPETWLVLATVASAALSYELRAVMKRMGAYYLTPAHTAIAPLSQWRWHLEGTWLSLYGLFGGLTKGFPGATAHRAEITLAGGFALLCGLLSLLRVLIRWTKADVADRLLVVTILVYLAAYEFSTVARPGSGGGYEFVGVIAMFAVLGARTISELRPLGRPAFRLAVTGVAAFGAVASLLSGTALFQPTVSNPVQPLAAWLEAHNLTYGLAAYWNASPITVYSGGRVAVRPIYRLPTGFVAEEWGADEQWYEPTENDARFVIAEQAPGGGMTQAQVVSSFGKPAKVYQVDGFSILVYPFNLLTMGHIVPPPPGD
jgi:hypothetical protein